jgi:hypothetical protein
VHYALFKPVFSFSSDEIPHVTNGAPVEPHVSFYLFFPGNKYPTCALRTSQTQCFFYFSVEIIPHMPLHTSQTPCFHFSPEINSPHLHCALVKPRVLIFPWNKYLTCVLRTRRTPCFYFSLQYPTCALRTNQTPSFSFFP